jgi:deferrochelatase/peroxidase EfeB
LGEPDRVHVIVTIHGFTLPDVAQVSDYVLEAEGHRAFALVSEKPFNGQVMRDPKTNRRIVHFGYADGISQPRFVGIHSPDDHPDRLPFAPIGVVLLGYPSAIPHVSWKVPQPNVLGRDGAFNAFRVLGQDVRAFEDFIAATASAYAGPDGVPDIDVELVAAKLCGRWRSGVALSLAPTRAEADLFDDELRLNDFDYIGGDGTGDADPDGLICPIGAHIRRTNPRGAHIVQRSSNRTRALIRRGIPYGPPWDAGDAATLDEPRGLLGNFICGSLAAQFEAMQYDWLNLGLQDPRITGTNDPLLGANDPATSTFTWPLGGTKPPLVLRGLPRFVTTQGGAYTFLPSIAAIRWIATQAW